MNHKLHNTILASAIVGAALLFGLLTAQPVKGNGYAAHHANPAHPAGSMIAEELRNDLARDFEQRTRRLETELTAAGSASEALASASALFATSMVEATLATVLEDVAHRQAAAPRRAAVATTADGQRERPARSRSAMAMPYFSTARGLRHGYGE